MDLEQIGIECDLAIETGGDQQINQLIDKVGSYLKADNLSDDTLAECNYFLANLYSRLSILRKEDFRGWRTGEFPENMVNAINKLRSAKTFAISRDDSLPKEIQTNLANEIARQRRTIECFEEWTCDFSLEGDSPYVSALSKARELIWTSSDLKKNFQKCSSRSYIARYFRVPVFFPKLFALQREGCSEPAVHFPR